MKDQRQPIDMVIITALQKELDAVLAQSQSWVKLDASKDSIHTFYTTRTAKGVSIVAACAKGMGQLNAALLAYDVIQYFDPKRIILVGIAAGISQEVQLGDVVVSDQVVDYELQKLTDDGTQVRWSVYRSDARLLNLAANTKRSDDWISRIHINRPKNIDDEAKNRSTCHVGVVLSGNKVIASASQAAALKSVWVRAAAIEMEATGVAATVDQVPSSKPAFIMVKGISDKADAHKDDSWQEYAAHAAAAFVWGLADQLEPQIVPVEPERVPPRADDVIDGIDFRGIRFALADTFNLVELKTLAFDLNIDWEELEGGTKTEKIISLINYAKRRRSLQKLFDFVNRDRDNLLIAFVPCVRDMPGLLSSQYRATAAASTTGGGSQTKATVASVTVPTVNVSGVQSVTITGGNVQLGSHNTQLITQNPPQKPGQNGR